jgi:hypothetical protein
MFVCGGGLLLIGTCLLLGVMFNFPRRGGLQCQSNAHTAAAHDASTTDHQSCVQGGVGIIRLGFGRRQALYVLIRFDSRLV